MRNPIRPFKSGNIRYLLLISIYFLYFQPTFAEEAASPPRPASVIHLTNGGFLPGALQDSEKPGLLRWKGDSFVNSFDFDLNIVNAVHKPAPSALPKPEGEFGFDLAGGDVLFGSLLQLDSKIAVIDSPKFGKLTVTRANIQRIFRWRDSELVYLGPNGLTGWRQTAPPKPNAWREESGELSTSEPGAALKGDLALPARSAIEFEISWKAKPDFVLAFGVGDDAKTLRKAFRFEVWDNDLVAHRETDAEADVASLATISPGAGRIHLLAFLDQTAGKLIVMSAAGKPLADLQVADAKPQAFPGVTLENKRGDVRLERLRITRWNGDAPSQTSQEKSSVKQIDNSVMTGTILRYEEQARALVVDNGAGETFIPLDKVASISLSPRVSTAPRSVRAVFQDGTRLSGNLLRIENGKLHFAVPGVDETTKLDLESLHSLVVLKHEGSPELKSLPRLELESTRIPGQLVDSKERPDAGCLVWQPQGSSTTSALRPGVSGRVVFKEPPVPAPKSLQVQMIRPAPVGGLQRFVRGFAGGAAAPQTPQNRRSLYLRTGDVIPSEITRIDDKGVSFRSPLSENTFVAHEKVKAVELSIESPATIRLNKTKRERLLTLPRMQKGSPPTHLIRSKNGDYLRARVLKMDDRTLQIETRLEEKDLPRDRVSRIIWLHADELDPPKPANSTNLATRVQVVRGDGTRLTFYPERYADATLSGKSDVLGICRVRLAEIDQLLIGSTIESEVSLTTYQKWKLQNAPEPKVNQDASDPSQPGRAPGTESTLVGKPAPDFKLDLLGGKPFTLADSKGHVVVLDFWATWCGPCLQAMPQVDKVVREFKEQGVQLVAVNLQETPKEISAMLERHKLDLTVALDVDGVVAAKYGANAIPQTVVIDREGKVARLFIGGGPHLGDQLREALTAQFSPPKPKDAADVKLP